MSDDKDLREILTEVFYQGAAWERGEQVSCLWTVQAALSSIKQLEGTGDNNDDSWADSRSKLIGQETAELVQETIKDFVEGK